MKDYDVMVGCLEKYKHLVMYFGLGNIFMFMFWLYILCIAHPFCVCVAMIG